ncbi:hypothetical protein JY651_28740 [Pyxidicoccus parkwayensis]|uniref:Uncharacterized protein n=1 Tax=Pyxidicoccus parkwayensis TaxID=2813578 RepID=A0ABX7NKD7_9BACT|nr:hypothetical protein [Pyxidicoccus parkwaysis]QSQ19320.1 hypothetical protein JY651_28740 [Pyxidicoccus parkwaysis]
MHPLRTQIGHLYKADHQALAPAQQAEGSRNGAAFDVSKYGSGTLVVNVGTVAGTPSATSLTYTLEASPDGTNGWAPLKNADGANVALTFTAGGACKELDFDLQYANAEHHFLRVVETVDFTGGTTPSVVAGATLVLGGGQRLPL